MTKPVEYGKRIASGFLLAAIVLYRHSLAYFLGGQCRFTPSCSAYALQAVEMHGPVKGMRLAVGRLCRCHPWGGEGYDPVLPVCSEK